MALSKNVYQDEFAVKLYQETHFFPKYVKNSLARIILAQLNLQRNSKILYVGSGDGSCFLVPLIISFLKLTKNKSSNLTIVCLDNSEKMLKALINNLTNLGFSFFRGWYRKDRIKIQVHLEDIENPLIIKLENDFDILLCPFVLHHLINWRLIFARLLLYLKPGGRVVFGERLGDIAYMDGNFSEFKRDSYIFQEFLNFAKERNQISIWLPEIKASNYSSLFEALKSAQNEIKEYSWRWDNKANLKNWIKNKVYTHFWLGLKDGEINKILKKINLNNVVHFKDGLKLFIAKINNPNLMSKDVLSFFPKEILPKLWQPILYTSKTSERIYFQLKRLLYLLATHDTFTGMTQWVFSVYWSPNGKKCHSSIPLMIFDYKPLEEKDIKNRVICLLRYFKTARQIKTELMDFIFRNFRQKPIVIVRRKQDLFKLKIECRWDSAIDLRGFCRCLYLFIDIPDYNKNANRANYQKLDEIITNFESIRKLRSNWYEINWQEVMDKYLDRITPYEINTQIAEQIDLPEEIIIDDSNKKTKKLLQICNALLQLMIDGNLTHIVYIPSEFYYLKDKKPSFGYGGIIFGENLNLTNKYGFSYNQMEEYLLERVKWCKLVVDRIISQIGPNKL